MLFESSSNNSFGLVNNRQAGSLPGGLLFFKEIKYRRSPLAFIPGVQTTG